MEQSAAEQQKDAEMAKSSDQGEQQQKPDKKEARDKLLVQLESRVRTLENENQIVKLLPVTLEVVQNAKATYDQYIKNTKQDSNHNNGGPEVHVFYNIVKSLQGCEMRDASLQNYKLSLRRIMLMIEKGGLEASEEWISTANVVPTYKDPKKEQK